MNKFKKFISALIVYVFAITFLPVNALADVTKDKTGVPQYLKYTDCYRTYECIQYNKNEIFINKGEKTDGYKEHWYSMQNNSNVMKDVDDISKIEARKGWIKTNLHDGIPRSIVDFHKGDYNYYGDYSDPDYENYEYKLKVGEGINAKYTKINMVYKPYFPVLNWTIISNNDIYITGYENNSFILCKYILKDNEYVFDESFGKVNLGRKEDYLTYDLDCDHLDNSYDCDINGNIWTIHYEGDKQYVQKLEGNHFVNKYEVTPGMFGITVYDDNHLTVWNSQRYTMINPETKPDGYSNAPVVSKPEAGNNAAGSADKDLSKTLTSVTAVDKNGTTKTEVNSKLLSDAENVVNVNSASKTSNEVSFTDIDTLRTGKGSLKVNFGNEATVKLPLSVFSSDALKNAKKVTLKQKVSNNDAILKNLDGVKKVFEFDLVVENKDGSTTEIHNFAKGKAEITLSLTDEDFKGLNKDNLGVYYLNEKTGKLEALDTKVNGNKFTFTTSHFSKFVVADKVNADKFTAGNLLAKTNDKTTVNKNVTKSVKPVAAKTKSSLPKTGAVIGTSVIAVISLVFIGLGVVTFRKRRIAK